MKFSCEKRVLWQNCIVLVSVGTLSTHVTEEQMQPNIILRLNILGVKKEKTGSDSLVFMSFRY